MGFLSGIYFSHLFWAVFAASGTISVTLMKLNKLKIVKVSLSLLFWGMFLILFAGMINHESNISHFLKEVEKNLVEANVESKKALSQGRDIKYGVQVSLRDGSKYLINDVNIEERKIKLFDKNTTDDDKFENFKLRELVYGGYSFSRIELSEEEKEMAMKKSKVKKARQPMR